MLCQSHVPSMKMVQRDIFGIYGKAFMKVKKLFKNATYLAVRSKIIPSRSQSMVVTVFVPLAILFHFALPHLVDVTSFKAIPVLILFNMMCWSSLRATYRYPDTSLVTCLASSAVLSMVPPVLLGTDLLRKVSLFHMLGHTIFFCTMEETLRQAARVIPYPYVAHPVIAALVRALIITIVSSFLQTSIETAMIGTVALILGPQLKIVLPLDRRVPILPYVTLT